MRRFLVLFIALALAVPAPASAGDGDAPDTPPPASLLELTRLVEAYIDELAHVPPFGFADRIARRQAMVAGVDLFVGTIRAAAIRYVDTHVPEPVRSVINALPGDTTVAELVAAVNDAATDPVSTWIGQEVGLDLVSLRASLDRLRLMVGDAAPERVCPVDGSVYFTNDWGDERPGERTHKGNDLYAPLRTPVVAIESGVVVQANWHYAGGRQIYFRADSTGDVYYYAHLDYWAKWIWTGTRVEPGDVIGLLGQSGNADVPHLHFGWMPASNDVDLDNLQNPYPLLLEICS